MGMPGYLKSSKSFWCWPLWGGITPETFANNELGSGSASQAYPIGVWESLERDSGSISEAVNELPWPIETQREVLVLATLL